MSDPFDSRQIRRAFGRAAPGYRALAVLQAEVGSRLVEQLDYCTQPPQRLLDLGCGTGEASALLRRRWPRAWIGAVDLALPMLREANRQQRLFRRFERICADARALPLADASIDLIHSNLCFQWIADLPGLLAELRRVLRPQGMLLFSTFTLGTLSELDAAFAEADPGHRHVSPFASLQQIGDALLAAGFRDPVVDSDRFTLRYREVSDLLRELRGIGAGNALADRRRSLTGKARFAAMQAAYERLRVDGRLPARYEVAYAHAWAPAPGQPRRHAGLELASFPADRLPIRRRE